MGIRAVATKGLSHVWSGFILDGTHPSIYKDMESWVADRAMWTINRVRQQEMGNRGVERDPLHPCSAGLLADGCMVE